MSTKVVRIDADSAEEAAAAARLLGVPPGELLAQAWRRYRETEEFRATFETAQKAMSSGDLEHLVHRLRETSMLRASERASRARQGNAPS